MFAGEAPGADEDDQGFPFVGRAGQLLTKIIESIGLKREDVFIGNVNYSLPLGLDVSTSMKFASGRPFTARAGTTDLNADGQTNDRPIVDGVMFKRNSFRNGGFKDVALRVQKNFILSRGTVSVSMEAFNLFNFANVTLGASQMVYGAGSTPVPANFMQYRDAAGQYIASSGNTAGDPRTLQFGVRFGF
mgnify:CR=1 FL=1